MDNKNKNKLLREEFLKEKSLRVREDFLNIWDRYYDLIGQLVIGDSFEICKYLGMAMDNQDYYHVLMVPNRGVVCSSCVGGCIRLKHSISDDEYDRMERTFDLNVTYWNNNVLKTGTEFSDNFGGPLFTSLEDLVSINVISDDELVSLGFEESKEADPVFNIKGHIKRTGIKTPDAFPSGKERNETRYTHEFFVFDKKMQEVIFTGVIPTWRTVESLKQLSDFINHSLDS